ncbi:Muniscin C-terminal mu homology domain-containing protein [Dipodascopsis uninucleata]
MDVIHENLAGIAQNIEHAEGKVEKYKKKGGSKSSSKISEAHENVNNAIASWDTEAPLVFEKLQNIDEQRLLSLKDLLTRFQTSEVDKAQKIVSLCEQNINALLSFEPENEIKVFSAQIQANGLPSHLKSLSGVNHAPSIAPSSRSSTMIPPPQVPSSPSKPSVPKQSFTGRKKSGIPDDSSSVSTSTTPAKSRFSRMSTILRPGKSDNSGRRGLFGSHKDKDKGVSSTDVYSEQISVSPVPESSVGSDSASVVSSRSHASARPTPPVSRHSSSNFVTSGAVSTNNSFNQKLQSPLPPPPPPHGSRREDPDAINIIGYSDRSPTSVSQSSQQATLTEQVPNQPVATVRDGAPQPIRVDSEGYSIPPPVPRDLAEPFETGDFNEEDDQPNSAIMVDIQKEAVGEEGREEELAAFDRIATSLKSQTPNSRRSIRGRRSEIPSNFPTIPATANSETATSSSHGIPPPPPPHRGEVISEKAGGSPKTTVNQPPEFSTIQDSSIVGNGNMPGAFVEGPVVEKEAPIHNGDVGGTTEKLPVVPFLEPSIQQITSDEKSAENTVSDGVTKVENTLPASSVFLPVTDATTLSPTNLTSPPVAAEPKPAIDDMVRPEVTPEAVEQTPLTVQENPVPIGSESLSNIPSSTAHPEFLAPGLSGSVVETINASFSGASVTRSLIVGEIAVANAMQSGGSAPIAVPISLRFINTGSLDRIVPNDSVIRKTKEDEYMLQTSSLGATPVTVFKYSRPLDNSILPVVIDAVWKFEPHQTSVLIMYRLNEMFPSESVAFSEFSVSLGVESAVVTGCQSKPSGLFNKETGRLTIPLTSEDGSVYTLTKGSEERALVRFWTEAQATEQKPGVECQFRFDPTSIESYASVPDLEYAVTMSAASTPAESDDPFADSEGIDKQGSEEWKQIESVRTVVSGRYFTSS